MHNIFKKLIQFGSAVSIVSFSLLIKTWACPILEGNYVCPDEQKGQLQFSVQQIKKGNITTYIMKEEGQPDEELIADNKSRTVKDGTSEMTTKSNCDGHTKLITHFLASDSDMDTKLEGTQYVQLDSNKHLQTTTKGKVTIGNQVIPINEFTVCPPKTK